MTHVPHTPAEAAPPPKGVSRRDWRRLIGWARAGDYALEVVSVGLMVVLAIGFGGYAGRRALVGELAETYLRDRGVEASVEVLAVDARGFVGRVRLGSPTDPDFKAERVEVWLAAPPPPEGPYALRPAAIRVVGPQLKARWTGERLSFGALDPLIQEMLERPKTDDRPGPRVLIENGSLRLATPYGLVAAAGSGAVDDSRVERLDLTLRPATLKGSAFGAQLRGGTVRVNVRGERADVRLNLAFSELQSASAELDDAVLTLSGQAPYPDMKARRLEGPVALSVGVRAARAQAGGASLGWAEFDLAARGSVDGPMDSPRFHGGLDGVLRSARLQAGEADVRTLRTSARLTDASLALADGGLGGRAALAAEARAERATLGRVAVAAPQAALGSAALSFSSTDDGFRAAGPMRLTAAASQLTAGEQSARGLRLSAVSSAADLRAGSAGLRGAGPVRARLSAASAAARQGEAASLDADVTTTLAVLSGSAPVSGRATAGRLQLAASSTPLTVSDARLRFDGRAGAGALALNGGFSGRAALPPAQARSIAAGLPIVGDSPAYATAIARSLSALAIEAPGLRLAGGQVSLTAPVRLRGPDGAQGELTPDGGGLALSGAGVTGAFALAVRGGGLPAISAKVDRLSFRNGDFTAEGGVRAALDIPLAEGAVVEARGRAASRAGAFTFAAADCVRLSAERVELGENDVEALSARLCPEGGEPVVQTNARGYRIRGRFAEAAGAVPFLQALASAASGSLDARGGASGLSAVDVRLASAEVTDTAPDAGLERRFHPIALTGTAALGQGSWRAALNVLDAPAGTKLAEAALVHEVVAGRGGVDITARDLRFSPEGLQPHDLSPLAAGAVSKVEGAVDFTGRIAWSKGALPISQGRASTAGLSFDGPLGRVVNLGPGITFSSLTPLIAPPGQLLTAERVEAFTPLTDIRAEIGFDAEALQLQSAQFRAAGGQVTVESMRLPFAEPRTLTGAVRLDDVDLGGLIETTGFADKVQLEAVVDGRIPFVAAPSGLSFENGELRSVRPGRLSIARQALTQVSASGAPAVVAGAEGAPAAAPPPNAFQDWAYQALENLAYNDLEVSVDSRPEGRLGMIFSVKGRHDPPTEQRARIGILDLLRGQAFQRKIPLPSDTPVNLTLDTSINFDELLRTWLDIQRERSAPVQAGRPTPAP